MGIFQKAISANGYARQGTVTVLLNPNSSATHTISGSSAQNPSKVENVINGRLDEVTYYQTTGGSGS